MTGWKKSGNTAVITGGASGMGLEFARRYAAAGMQVAIADNNADALKAAQEELASLAASPDWVLAHNCDVSNFEEVCTFRDAVIARFGKVHCLMNNAGRGLPVGAPWESIEALRTTMGTNLGGIVHGCHAFIPGMLDHGEAGAVINTGSKQGITRPPGNYAYNLSKAGVLAYSESVAHALRNTDGCQLSAHLLVPGFVYTPMISAVLPEKPPFAWTAQQTVDFALPAIEAGEFYVLCPDGETNREIDGKRIVWNAQDIAHGRPALSRWHADYKDEFEGYMAE